MLVGVTISGMAQGDPDRWKSIAALTALRIAVMCGLAWPLRVSSLVNFISETILLGFNAGAACTTALTQLPKLFGVKRGGEDFLERLVILGAQIPQTNLAVLAFGLVALHIHEAVREKMGSSHGLPQLVVCDLSTTVELDVAGAELYAVATGCGSCRQG